MKRFVAIGISALGALITATMTAKAVVDAGTGPSATELFVCAMFVAFVAFGVSELESGR